MKLIFIESEGVHIDIDSIDGKKYTSQEVDDLIVLAGSLSQSYERRAMQQAMIDEVEWFELYPSAKIAISRSLKNKIQKIKDEIASLQSQKDLMLTKFISQVSDMDDQQKIRDEINIDYEEKLEYLKNKLSTIQSSYHYVSKWDKKTSSKKGSKLTQKDIDMAKDIPINNFISVNRMKKAKCIFHADKTASMHIYDNNKFYCFGCSKHGSVIDIVMQLHQLDFKGAVLKLTGK